MPDLVAPVVTPDTFFAGEQPVVRGARVQLRPWRADDAPDLVRAYADPGIQQWHLRSMDAAEAPGWIEVHRRRWRQHIGVDWAICDEPDGPALGRIAFHRFVLQEGIGEVAYWVAPEARGRRLAPRALNLVADWAFTRGLHRIEVGHAVANRASCRVAERAGFPLEGIRRSELLHADGWHDTHLHARLATDRAWSPS